MQLNLWTLPTGSGVKLRNGEALAASLTSGETGPHNRRTAPPGISSQHR